MRAVMRFGSRKVLGRVDRDPHPLVAEGEQLPFAGELRERRLLVVASLRQTLERLVVEHVDAAVHPVREARRLAKTCDAIVRSQLDDAELRHERRHDDRRGPPTLAVAPEQRLEVDVMELVAVEGVERP